MVEVYIADSAGDYHQIDVSDLHHTQYRDFQKGETLSFRTKAPIRSGAWVKVVENGGVIFRGSASARSGKWGEPLEWECSPIPQILKDSVPWHMRYGAPPVVGDYVALTISDVLSSDAPSQVEGVSRYVPGLIWKYHSLMTVSPTSREGGVWRYQYWGTDPRAVGKDVYVGGHKCTEVSDFGTLTDSPYQFYRDEDLWVWGAGEGDFGPVCVDNYRDTGLRLGNLDRAGDYLLAPLDISVDDNYWIIIEKFLFDMGIYIRLRHVGDLTYLDGSINPWGRGSSESGAFTLHPGDYTSLKRTAPRDLPPTALVGQGAGQEITRVVYTRANLSQRGPWRERRLDVPEGQLASNGGRMEAIVDSEWADVSKADYIEMETEIGYFDPGDWLDIVVSPSETITAQISEIARDLSNLRKIRLGGAYASPTNAYLAQQQSQSVIDMRGGQIVGSAEDTDNLGPATTASISWSATGDRDTSKILVDLRATEPSDSSESGLSVTYTLTITNTTYPGGKVIAILPHQSWGTDPVFVGLNITPWCSIDDTNETLEIGVSDPSGNLSETLGYTITIRGLGRYGQTPIKTLTPTMPPISSTLTVNYASNFIYAAANGYGGDSSGYAYFYLANVSKPSWDFKLVLVHRPRISGNGGCNGESTPYIKTYGVTYYGQTRHPSYVEQQFEDDWPKNPYTGADWTQDELDDLQVGIILRVYNGYYFNETYYCAIRFGGVWVELR